MSEQLHAAGYDVPSCSDGYSGISIQLPSIKVELSDKELDALSEFARRCGESLPELMRKIVIRDATLADGYGADDSSYDFRVISAAEGSGDSDRKDIERTYNSIRRILGWREIHL